MGCTTISDSRSTRKATGTGPLAECRTAIRLKPDDAMAHNNLGLARYEKGDWDGAIAEYRAAHSPPAGLRERTTASASPSTRKATATGPLRNTARRHSPPAGFRMGSQQPRLSRSATRATWTGRWRNTGSAALKPQPDDKRTTTSASRLGRKGDGDGAIAEYREALRLNPNNAYGALQPRPRAREQGRPRRRDREVPRGAALEPQE